MSEAGSFMRNRTEIKALFKDLYKWLVYSSTR
jgi:hypothetical protein